jgi:adenylosuccinate synthase
MKDMIVTGLLFGDEGKGTTVDLLATQNRPMSVVRTGGPQAAHNVIAGPLHHTFAQFGSASFQQVPTVLSQHMLVNPFTLVVEGDLLASKARWNPFPDLLISGSALMITPIHVWLNKKREEARGAAAHGSTGEGIGETRLFHIRHPEQAPIMSDLLPENLNRLKDKLVFLREYAQSEAEAIWGEGEVEVERLHGNYVELSTDGFLNIVSDDIISDHINTGFIIFENSQGILLDESYGFHPHTTWGSATSENAQRLLADAGKETGTVVGVLRTYATRHGFGPFPSELPDTPENTLLFPEQHNAYGRYQGSWRRGLLDLPLLEYAVRANQGVDVLSLTHCDLFKPVTPVVEAYDPWQHIPSDFFKRDREQQEKVTSALMALTLDDAVTGRYSTLQALESVLEDTLKAPVVYESFGADRSDKKTR